MIPDQITIRSGQSLHGETGVTGDKSLSHRALLLGALAEGTTQVRGWLAAGDTEATLRVIQQLGIKVDRHDTTTLTLYGGKLSPADNPLDFDNAGTGIRLAAGIMAAQPFASVLDGSQQLRRRPMKRITDPLRLMGADITGVDGRAPLTVKPAKLKGVHYSMPVASAQVKSAVILAALFADGETIIEQPGPARDHTERMLASMGAKIAVDGDRVIVTPGAKLSPIDMTVPGDFSSAAFLIVAALITPDSDVTITGVNLNATRTGLLDVLLEMGADITVTETGLEAGEPVGTLRVCSSELKGVEIGGETVVRMIDEFPVLMVAALCGSGVTRVRDARELRVKETDRIAVMAAELRKLGAEIDEYEDGFSVAGAQTLNGAPVDGHDDHRVAMSLMVAGLIAGGQTLVTDASCAADSYPDFADALRRLGADLLAGDVVR